MFLNYLSVEQSELPDIFDYFFERKVNQIVESVNVAETVNNEKKKRVFTSFARPACLCRSALGNKVKICLFSTHLCYE